MATRHTGTPWNKGKLVGQKPPLRPKDVWAIRVRLQVAERSRDLALFNLAIDSKLRGCDLVALRVNDVAPSGRVRGRALVLQRKTNRPVQFELTDQTREALESWIRVAQLRAAGPLFPEPPGARAADHAAALCQARRPMDHLSRSRARGLRHALAPSNEGGADLPADRQPTRRAAPARAQQDREHRPLPRHRGRGRTHNRGAGRDLKRPLFCQKRTCSDYRGDLYRFVIVECSSA